MIAGLRQALTRGQTIRIPIRPAGGPTVRTAALAQDLIGSANCVKPKQPYLPNDWVRGGEGGGEGKLIHR